MSMISIDKGGKKHTGGGDYSDFFFSNSFNINFVIFTLELVRKIHGTSFT